MRDLGQENSPGFIFSNNLSLKFDKTLEGTPINVHIDLDDLEIEPTKINEVVRLLQEDEELAEPDKAMLVLELKQSMTKEKLSSYLGVPVENLVAQNIVDKEGRSLRFEVKEPTAEIAGRIRENIKPLQLDFVYVDTGTELYEAIRQELAKVDKETIVHDTSLLLSAAGDDPNGTGPIVRSLTDEAMMSEPSEVKTEDDVKPPGGIDLNSEFLDMQIKRDGNGVPLPLEFQDYENINVQGFVPLIIDVTPAVNIPILSSIIDELNKNS